MNAGAVPLMAGNRSSRKGFTQGPLLEDQNFGNFMPGGSLGILPPPPSPPRRNRAERRCARAAPWCCSDGWSPACLCGWMKNEAFLSIFCTLTPFLFFHFSIDYFVAFFTISSGQATPSFLKPSFIFLNMLE